MGIYILSNVAKRELVDILHKGSEEWGDAQAEAYVNKLYDTLDLLAAMPHFGTLCKDVPGFEGATDTLRRYTYKPYVILYDEAPPDIILVARIASGRLKPGALMRGFKKLTYN